MRQLNPQQRLFVFYMFERQRCSATAAVRLAGYADPGPQSSSARSYASQLMHNPKIKAAMHEYAKDRIHAMLPDASRAMQEILNDAQHVDRYKVAKAIHGLSGITEVVEKHVVHEHSLISPQQKIEAIRAFAIQNGLDPTKMLGTITDAEFTEVQSPQEMSIEDELAELA